MQQTIQQLTQALLQVVGANNNNNNNRGADELHRNFRNLNPPRFSGTTNPDEAENWLKETERIFRLAPFDIQTYPEMVRRAQCLEDATELTERIKGRMFRKEQTFGVSSMPTNGKKRPLSITDGPIQERKPKVPTTTAPNNKPRCKHCDKLGHTTEELILEEGRKKGKTWTAPVIAAARYAAITGVSRSAFRMRHEHDGPHRHVPKPEPGQAGRFACRARPHRRGQNRDGIPRESDHDHTHEDGTDEETQE
ncbi:hypothetical protein Taro_022721 [Colocasia esculenta]|uniref:Uncharacterized protein n=1 Tax=Colocasia esculenta TaxID=4460 RepID=A0A843VC92_COLES|nr:hypothetical protein [Colocasia esculenta]